MKLSLVLSMASLFSFLLGGCSSPTENVLFEGSYDGEPYQIKSHETRTFNGSRVDWRIKLGNLPELPINITMRRGTPIPLNEAVTTDWGPPYSDAIYGDHKCVYFGAAPAYSNKGDDYSDEMEAQHDHTMLYVSKIVGSKEYDQYAAWMKSEWPKVDKALASDPNNNFPHLIGLVHGAKGQFTRNFRGKCDGAFYVLRVDPDGYVNLGLDDGSAESNHMRHCKVQMPQKMIVLSEIYLWKDLKSTKSEIAKFKDAEGKTIETYFKLRD